MHSAPILLVVPIIFFPLLGSIHCISNGPPKRRGIFASTEEYPIPPPPPLPKIHYGPKPPTQIFVSKLSPDEHLGPSPPHHHHRVHPHRGPPIHIHSHLHNSIIPSHSILPPSPPPHSIQLKLPPPSRGGHGPPIPTIQSQGPPQIHIRQHGPLQHGPLQHGPLQHGHLQYGPIQHGPTQHGSIQHGPTQHGPSQHGPTQHGPTQHGPIHHGPIQHESIQIGPSISHGPFGPPSISSSALSQPHHFSFQHHGPPRDLLIHNRPIHHSPPPPPPAPTPPAPPPPPPPPPQPPKPFAGWKPPPPPPTFRAPAVKESFHASPSAIYQTTNHFLRDDEDKGPIHTIPAPNLSLSDRPAGGSSYHKPPGKESLPQVTKSVHSDHTPLEVYSVKGYQVIEDSTAHKPGQPSYFAPDPDPGVPAPRVPPTHDPYSIPSNGQQPLDLIIQQHNEKQNHQLQQLQHLSASLENGGNPNGNTLTAQDLFNIFNTINQQQLHVIPPAPDSDTDTFNNPQSQDEIYNSIHQHLSQPEDFRPQFQTFNYEEQSKLSPHGSDSYPLGASNIEYKRAVAMQESMHQPFNTMPKTTMQVSLRNSITHQQQHYENAMANLNNNIKAQQQLHSGTKTRVSNVEKGVINNHVDNTDEEQNNQEEEDGEEEEEEEQTSPDTLSTEDVTLKSLRPLMYTTLPNKKAADTLANLAAAGLSKSTSTTVSMSTSLQTEDNQDGKNNNDSGHSSDEDDEERGETGDEEEYSEKQENSKSIQNHNGIIHGRHTNHNNHNNDNNNVQLQKAIQIYETSYFDQDVRNSGSSSNSNINNGGKIRTTNDKDYQNDNDDDYSSREQDSSDMEESETQSRYKSGDQSNQSDSGSYGTRIRPKRN